MCIIFFVGLGNNFCSRQMGETKCGERMLSMDNFFGTCYVFVCNKTGYKQ